MRPGLILSVAVFLFGATAGLLLGSGRTLFAQEGAPQGLAEAQAVMGTAFTFQGKLHNEGTPANGAFDLRFTLFDAAEAGTQIGAVLTLQQVMVTDGAFAVRLDFGGGAFTGEARYLQVEVRSTDPATNTSEDFTLLSPRQELTPGVYALFSAGAAWDGLTGVPAGFADGVDNVGADTLGELDCTKDQVAQWNGSAWVCSNTVKDLLTRMTALETLLAHFSRDGNEITITSANLRVVNGTGTTDGDPNGLGNIIIGYNELRPGAEAVNNRSGSHMLVVGKEHNYSGFGGIVLGFHNETSGDYASVSGGFGNTANYAYASVSGGVGNTASNLAASVSGGQGNIASGNWASVSGGYQNSASANYAAVSGGSGNHADGQYASVSGGENNFASGGHTSVSAGYGNTASLDHASVSGGSYNTASNYSASVSGGGHNTASGIATSVSAGYQNVASLDYASVSGGHLNIASQGYASVSGGSHNIASGEASSVSGGSTNAAEGLAASVSGGYLNIANGVASSVCGGKDNNASAYYSSVSGGQENTASGEASTVSGGVFRKAPGKWDWRAGGLFEDG